MYTSCFRIQTDTTQILSLQFLPQQRLEGLTVFGEFLDTLMELVECHRVLKKFPSELRLVFNVRDFGDRSGGSG